jgi:hypothetical protein
MDFLTAEYKDLPAEPAHAFIVFEDRLTKRLMRFANTADFDRISLDKKLKYVTDIDQFVTVFNFEPQKYFDRVKISIFDLASNHFSEFYARIQESVSAEKMRLVKQDINQVFTSVELDGDAKIEIRELISKVKLQLDKLDVSMVKKDSLYKKLNIFLDEVDRARTGLAAFAAAQVQVAYEAGLDEQKFERIVGYFERIMKAIGRGSKEQPHLPKPDEYKRIEGPKTELTEGENS